MPRQRTRLSYSSARSPGWTRAPERAARARRRDRRRAAGQRPPAPSAPWPWRNDLSREPSERRRLIRNLGPVRVSPHTSRGEARRRPIRCHLRPPRGVSGGILTAWQGDVYTVTPVSRICRQTAVHLRDERGHAPVLGYAADRCRSRIEAAERISTRVVDGSFWRSILLASRWLTRDGAPVS